MADEVEVVEQYRLPHPALGTIEVVKIMRVPKSEKFPEGVKYRLHYGHTEGRDDPIIRFDNSHGRHETRRGRGGDHRLPRFGSAVRAISETSLRTRRTTRR